MSGVSYFSQAGESQAGQEKVRKKIITSQEILVFCQKSGKIKSKYEVYMISQVKSKNDVCSQDMYGYGSLLVLTVKLLNNGHPFCRGLVTIVDECPLVQGCGKMLTNPSVWRGQGRLIYTKSIF